MLVHVITNMEENKVKTTINIDENLWKKFSIRVIEDYGGRKKNDVIEELIKDYLKKKGSR